MPEMPGERFRKEQRMAETFDVIDFILNNRSYYEDLLTRSTYHSNALEGSNLTRNETYALLFDSNHSPISSSAKEIHQAINYNRAMKSLLNRLKNHNRLSVEDLINANDTINENVIIGGGYRVDPANISGSSSKVFPEPEEIEQFIEDYITRYNDYMDIGFDMDDVAEMHLEFENIHPFSDGNGRTGRILIDSMLLGGNQAPIVIPLDQRNDYLKMLETNNVKGLRDMFDELQQEEEERIRQFNSFEQ